MLASFQNEKKDFIPGEWWMGEKYDGVRCCWNPETKKIYTRYGKFVNLNPNMEAHMPQLVTDFELWFGRGQFTLSYSVVRDSEIGNNWESLRAIIFDLAAINFQQLPFEERYTHLLAITNSHHPFSLVVARMKCEGNQHMQRETNNLIEGGGEGIILRRVNSLYEHGRSPSLIKAKASVGDREGIVVAVSDDKSLIIKLPNGKTMPVPHSSVHLTHSPCVGSIVSFSFSSFSRRDLPSDPIVFRVRDDLDWNDVKKSDVYDKQGDFTAKPIRYWTEQNMRGFLMKYAKERNLDPLLSDSWYSITSEDIRQGGSAILSKYKGGYYHAVEHLFPDIKFDKSKLHGYMINDIRNRRNFFEELAKAQGYDPLVPEPWYLFGNKRIIQSLGGSTALLNSGKGYFESLKLLFPEIAIDKNKFHQFMWREEENRKKFFEWYAKKNEFDPLVPDNWYRVSIESIMSFKGARRVVYYHKMSVYQALMDLFPNIGIDKTKFVDQSMWHQRESRRKFFEDYATDHSFDPLIVSNWYSQPFEKLMATKGIQGVLFHHENSISRALSDLFPELKVDPTMLQKSRWQDKNNARRFFENFAKENDFHPLTPENWTPKIRRMLRSSKIVQKIIVFHNNSVLQALLDVFPEAPWKNVLKKYYWRDINTRKRFFENYAQLNGFDPLINENWYSVHIEDILKYQGARGVLYFHDNNLSKALIELFPNVTFDKAKFTNPTKVGYFWKNEENRRKFFEKYASELHFDYLIASNWYNQIPEKILTVKGGRSVIKYHNNSVMQALLDLFPDIGLDETTLSHNWLSDEKEKEKNEVEAESESTNHPPVSLREAKSVVAEHKAKEKRELRESKKLATPSNIKGFKTNKDSLWNEESKRRAFFENYANQNNFDPLIADNWYGPLRNNIRSCKGIYGVIEHHDMSIIKALLSLFPEIGLSKEKFSQKWYNPATRRDYFENYAKENQFDPLNSENWYTIPKTKMLSLKGIHGVISYHNGSVIDALVDLFPEIGLEKSLFKRSSFWDKPEKRRDFFAQFALSHNFDPLIPHHWYNVPLHQISSSKGAYSVELNHGTLAQALVDLYPNIGLDKSKLFLFHAKWREARARRDFFERYATENNFNPLLPLSWYSQKKSKIMSHKGAHRILFYHSNSLSRALLDLFPDIGLDPKLLLFK